MGRSPLLARNPGGPAGEGGSAEVYGPGIIPGERRSLHPQSRSRRLGRLVLVALGLWAATTAQAQDYKPPGSLFDPRLTELRTASVVWDARIPERRVVDQVCLVPDVATYLEAIASWDGRRFFPILIEDGEYTPKFLRAFRPARVVRVPARAQPIGADRLWEAAVAAVGRSWTEDDARAPSGDSAPRDKTLGPTPPGVVLSNADSTALAGAVALAAGRFQPLVRWSPGRRFADTLSGDDAEALAREVEERVGELLPNYRRLGDDCDFLTLAADYPYRYQGPDPKVPGLGPGPAALDDLIGRAPAPPEVGQPRLRWAYTGRLLGDATSSVYRAMCSLFLEPDAALLLDGYGEADGMFGPYGLRAAEAVLTRRFKTDLRVGPEQASVRGWHRAFDPSNRAGLLLINTSGGSTQFNINGGSGQTADVPSTSPTAIHIIHSFSAENPTDPNTIAGRWLANGAFVYMGSAFEPFLQSFRHPSLIALLLADRLPFAAAVRMTPFEITPFGNPWRLVVLGDPLYRVQAAPTRAPAASLPATKDWPSYRREPPPAVTSEPFARLAWAAKASVLAGVAKAPRESDDQVAAVLLSIPRDRLPAQVRPLHDALLTDALSRTARFTDLRSRLAAIPAAERSGDVKRWLETARMISLYRGLEADQWPDVVAACDELLRSDTSSELKAMLVARVGPLADKPSKTSLWIARLKAALKAVDPGTVLLIETELKRVQGATSTKDAPPPRRG